MPIFDSTKEMNLPAGGFDGLHANLSGFKTKSRNNRRKKVDGGLGITEK
jgi:hypothetical protein